MSCETTINHIIGGEVIDMWISKYICLFIIYSFMGWVYETLYCTIKNGKWSNRGFLYGPICPIYGTGAIAGSLTMNLLHENHIEPSWWQVFIFSVVASAVLEYVTSYVLEKIFHALWWDYSNLPLNLHGRISLFTSLGFGFAGLLIIYIIVPFTENAVSYMPPTIMVLLAVCLTLIFVIDFIFTVSALHNFNESIINERLSSISDFVKGTVRRVRLFRDKNKQLETIKNSLLLKIQSITKREKNTQK